MIDYTLRAVTHLTALLDFYEENERLEAMRGLQRAMREAWAKIEADPAGGLPTPRPYQRLSRKGILWRHSGSHWGLTDAAHGLQSAQSSTTKPT